MRLYILGFISILLKKCFQFHKNLYVLFQMCWYILFYLGILQNFLHMLYIHSTNHNLEQADGKSLDYIWSIHQNINFDKLQSVKCLILYNFEATYLQIASYYWLLNNLTFFNRLYIKARGSKYYLSDAFPSSIYSWSISHMWEHGFFTFGRLAAVHRGTFCQ